MSTSATLQRLAILILCLSLVTACSDESNLRLTPIAPPATTNHVPEAERTPERIEVPVTVEVTRVFTQQVIVEATPSPPTPCAESRFEETGEITIGSLLPLSGPSAYSAGFAMQTALNLALEQVERRQEANGVTWRLITYDTAGHAERAAEFAHRLITLDCAAAIIGGYHSSVALVTAGVTELHEIPYIVLHAAADDLTSQRSSVFRIAPTFSTYAQMPAALVQQLSQDSTTPIADVLFIVEPAAVSPALSQSTLERLTEAGLQGEILAVDLPAQDFSSTIARILTRPSLPHILFIHINGDAALALHAQLLDAGIGPEHEVTIVNSQAARDIDAFWREVPGGVGTIASHFGPWPGQITEQGQEFVTAYSQFSTGWPKASVFAAYDALLLVENAVVRAETVNGSALLDALRQSDITLTAGHYRFENVLDSSERDASGEETVHDTQAHPQQWQNAPMYYLRYTEPDQPFDAMRIEWQNNNRQSDNK